MKAAFIHVALEKALDADMHHALIRIEQAALELEQTVARFARELTETRGPLSARKREELDIFAQDERAIGADLLTQLQALSSPQEVIAALHFGLSQDVPEAKVLLQHYPDSERAAGVEIIRLKERVLEEMVRFLEHYPLRAR